MINDTLLRLHVVLFIPILISNFSYSVLIATQLEISKLELIENFLGNQKFS